MQSFNNIIGTNLLANSHDDQTIKLASRVLTRPYALPPGDHVFEPTFHEDQTLNVAKRFYIIKNAPPPGGHVLQPTLTIFGLIKCSAPWGPYIIGTILLTKVLTRFYYSHMWPYYKKCPASWWPCFKGAFSHFG
ncbi:hypothetical protein DPMN_006014 [Dreissena polymorpha]|uniref:Uncharacterized protein n=1 Tax=Dreissena polymorpha TaxID=45954 RepID=A0A9D4MTB5_DREPO|nr:hypothetical protein DPMN_006014 [Dreissena polymorpha]